MRLAYPSRVGPSKHLQASIVLFPRLERYWIVGLFQSLHDLSLVAKLAFKVFPLRPQQSHTNAQLCYPFMDFMRPLQSAPFAWFGYPNLLSSHRLLPSIDVPVCVHSQDRRIRLFGTTLPIAVHVSPSWFLTTSTFYSNTKVHRFVAPCNRP
jgi:hypothetical protein